MTTASREQIKAETDPSASITELNGINGEVELSERIINAVSADAKLFDYIVLHIAHNRAEKISADTGKVIGQVIASQIEATYLEIHSRLQSDV